MNFIKKILPLSFTFDKSLALLITGVLLYLNLATAVSLTVWPLQLIPGLGTVVALIANAVLMPLAYIYTIVGIVFLFLSYFKKV